MKRRIEYRLQDVQQRMLNGHRPKVGLVTNGRNVEMTMPATTSPIGLEISINREPIERNVLNAVETAKMANRTSRKQQAADL
jgi:hypothetical protein